MEKLNQPPDFEGYSAADSVALLYTPLDGGAGRQRQDVLDASRFVNVQWSGGRKRFETVRDFYRAYIGRNAESFLIDLISADGTLTEYVANFVSFKPIGQQRGIGYVSQAQLEITPNVQLSVWPSAGVRVLGMHFDGSSFDETGHPVTTHETQPGAPNPTYPGSGQKFGTGYYRGTTYGNVLVSDNRGSLALNAAGKWRIGFWCKPEASLLSWNGGSVIELHYGGVTVENYSGGAQTKQLNISTLRIGVDVTKAYLRVEYLNAIANAGFPTNYLLSPIGDDMENAAIPMDGNWHYVEVGGDEVSTRAYIDGALAMDDHNTALLIASGERPMMASNVFTKQYFVVGAKHSGFTTHNVDPNNWLLGVSPYTDYQAIFSQNWTGGLEDIEVVQGVGPFGTIPTGPFGTVNRQMTLAPDQIGYGVDVGNDLLRIQNDGSIGQYSRNLFNNANLVTVSWICDAEEYAYVAQCYRAAVAGGGLGFTIDLLLDDTTALTPYLARFVPGSFSLASVQGETYNVRATLEVKPVDYDVENNPFVTDSGLSDRRLRAAFGLYVVVGKDVLFRLSKTHFHAGAGFYAIDGSDTERLKAKFLVGASGAYALTGNSIAFGIPIRYFVAAQTTFNLNGQSSLRPTIRKLLGAQGTFALNGQSSIRKHPDKTLTAAQGSFTFTGEAAALTFAGVPPAGHRYWRVTNVAVSSTDWQPCELQLWESSGVRADASTTTLTHNSTLYFGTIGRLVDSDYGNFLELYPFTTSSWVTWDFGVGVTKAVTGFKHADRGGGGAGSAFSTARLQYSDDNSTWTTFGNATGIAVSYSVLSAFIPFV